MAQGRYARLTPVVNSGRIMRPTAYRLLGIVTVCVFAVMVPHGVLGNPLAVDNNAVLKEVQNTEEYFPDGIGSTWKYTGRTRTETIERIADVVFTNEVS